jgi:hypothetical protein
MIEALRYKPARVGVPTRSLNLFNLFNSSNRTMALEFIQSLTEMSTIRTMALVFTQPLTEMVP